ncbi:Dynamin- protein 3A [Ancistrocladus abbreviatus]
MEDNGHASEPQAAPLGYSLIPVVNKLQDICAQSGIQLPIDLPQVAVVGSQSSGKSSVLEALVGRDFLPRGPDICTRRPLVLQLIQTKRAAAADGIEEEYGEFLHLPGKRFYDFLDIRREIQAETEREAGANRAISERPIRLKIYSPNVLDITLVDLPGITRVPVGDQPSDIEARIRTMILSYIRPRSCLILAVTPANLDLANSDALQIAGTVDPDGSRTIGVITKLDIMDRGTDARNLLLGKVIPLHNGYVGVVNRSQEDIMLRRSIKDALAAEEKYFRSHPVYINLADHCGVPQLAKKLNQILGQHIRENLPELKARISSQLVSLTKEYASYGEITESRSGQGALLLNILSKYAEAFSSLVEGKSEEMSTSELSGGARIHYIFQSIFVKSLEEVDPCGDLSDEYIRTAVQNARGPRSALFVPVVPFEVLVRRQIAQLLDPSLQCARFIYNELVKMTHRCRVSELQRFPILGRRVDEVTGNFLRENLEPAQSIIGHIIEMEMDYINTSHPKFIGGNKALEDAQRQTRSSRDALESDLFQASERTSGSRAIIVRPAANGFIRSAANGVINEQGARANTDTERNQATGHTSASVWGISSIFRGSDNRTSTREVQRSSSHSEPVYSVEHASTIIHLREPPAILRSSEPSEQEATEIAATKLLLTSYFDIVRKNIEDFVPKAVMHFLVNHTKRELHNVLIEKLYREDLFDEMLREPEEVAVKREHIRDTLQVLRQAFQTLDELPLEVEAVGKGYSFSTDSIGLPRNRGLPSSSFFATNI